jgi:hypothetical protein
MEFSRCGRRRTAGPSKLNSVRNIEVDILLGESSVLTAEAIEGLDAYHHEMAVSLERR